MNYWTQSASNIYVAAHRGWSSKYPENTMEAFRAAIDLQVDQVETDIRVTKDGVLVLMHDERVDRTTNGTGRVCDFTLEELRALDAGSWKGAEYAGAKVPTLEEFLKLVAPVEGLTIDFELKEYPTEGHEAVAFDVCDRALQMIKDAGLADRCVINTFHAGLHEYIQKKFGNYWKHHVYYPEAHNRAATVSPYTYAYCVCMFGDKYYIATPAEFEQLRAKGVRTWAGAGVKDEETVKAAVSCGAELITCNNPDEILAILRKMKLHK